MINFIKNKSNFEITKLECYHCLFTRTNFLKLIFFLFWKSAKRSIGFQIYNQNSLKRSYWLYIIKNTKYLASVI